MLHLSSTYQIDKKIIRKESFLIPSLFYFYFILGETKDSIQERAGRREGKVPVVDVNN